MENVFQQPFKEKFIKDLSETDFKVAVSGVIVSKNENTFLLDDSTGQITVSIINQGIPSYEYLRVFGKIMPYENGLELQAEIIQDLSKIDKEMHKKVKEVLS